MKIKEVTKQICIGLGIALLLITFILLMIFLPIAIDNNKIIHDIGEKYDVIVNKPEIETKTEDVENIEDISINAFKYISPIPAYDKETGKVVTPTFTLEKVYLVEFMEYTNCMRDTVSDGNKDIGEIKYITVGKEPFLVRESELDKYSEYGKGYRSMLFVGNIKVD